MVTQFVVCMYDVLQISYRCMYLTDYKISLDHILLQIVSVHHTSVGSVPITILWPGQQSQWNTALHVSALILPVSREPRFGTTA